MENKNRAYKNKEYGDSTGLNITYEHEVDYEDEGLLVKYEYKGKENFNSEAALASLLIEKKIHLNNFWWVDNLEQEQKERFSLNVNCNDVFAWACSDGENLDFKELKDLFNHYEKDNYWGTQIWCIKKRNMLPQKPVFDDIQKKGVWDLTTMNLDNNPSWSLEELKEIK